MYPSTPFVPQESRDGKRYRPLKTSCHLCEHPYVVHPVGRPKSIPQDSVVKINKQNQGFFHADFPGDPNAIGLFDEQSAKPKK